ncbi:VOC family protein [Paraburkholderia sp. NMBU_R16]|uniref:VOC family protein n=1 Tax=Paraburkholderia sp. NMBU_R16 TaxID=2698676 RepID=UPI0015630985|nr:VOC family protein [Paraburkholderia sp. NMBU_R16]NRO99005.1 VOC family protein [Paraburkholderia sp. NMBU_R16]
MEKPFRILGIHHVAIGAANKERLLPLWTDILGARVDHTHTSAAENVSEDICVLGRASHGVEIHLMEPVDSGKKSNVASLALHHIGLWVDDLSSAVSWMQTRGVRIAPGGIRKGASGHDICFIHPKANDDFPVAGEGALIELVQAPPDIVNSARAQLS